MMLLPNLTQLARENLNFSKSKMANGRYLKFKKTLMLQYLRSDSSYRIAIAIAAHFSASAW